MSQNLPPSVVAVAEPVLSIVVFIAFVLNTLHMIVLLDRHGKKTMIAYQTMQVCNTILVFVILGSVISMDMVHLRNHETYSISFCMWKDFFEELLLNMYPVTHMVVAILRKKMSTCRGDASVLIPRMLPLKQFGVGFVLTFASALFIPIARALKQEYTSSKKAILCSLTHDQVLVTFRLILCVCFDLIPVFIIIRTYQIIYVLFYRSHPNARETTGQHKRKRSSRLKTMKLSFVLLSAGLFFAWIPYVSLKIYRIVNTTQLITVYCLLCKVLVCLFHPITEGFFLSHQRKRLRLCITNLRSRPTFLNLKKSKEITVDYEIREPILHKGKVSTVIFSHESNSISSQNNSEKKMVPKKLSFCYVSTACNGSAHSESIEVMLNEDGPDRFNAIKKSRSKTITEYRTFENSFLLTSDESLGLDGTFEVTTQRQRHSDTRLLAFNCVSKKKTFRRCVSEIS